MQESHKDTEFYLDLLRKYGVPVVGKKLPKREGNCVIMLSV